MQIFKAVSFNDRDSKKSKVVSIAFTPKEQPLYKRVENLTSQEIRHLIDIDSYDQLCTKAQKDHRGVSQFIKVLLEKALHNRQDLIGSADVTFKNSKRIPYQRWYPYIEGYSPDFVKSIITRHVHDGGIIYEPFAGTGTTLFAADNLGYDTYYSEINPLLQFLIKTKIRVLKMPLTERFGLVQQMQEALPRLLRFDMPEDPIRAKSYADVFKKSVYFPQENHEKILKTRTFLRHMADGTAKDLLTIAVLASLIPASFLKKQGDLRFKTEAERSKGIADFADVLQENVAQICDDLQVSTADTMNREHTCIVENAKRIGSATCNRIGCVITSPPYLNGTNYIRNTKLELWFMGCLASDRDLRHFRDEILTSGINDVKLSAVTDVDLETASATYRHTAACLNAHAYDPRIPQMARCYFSEMHDVFDGLKDKLADGAELFIDIGDSIFNNIHIKTDVILQEIAGYVGYEWVETQKLRERRSRNGQILSQKLIHLKYHRH